MADPKNQFPSSKFGTPGFIKYANVFPRNEDPLSYFIADSANIDYRVADIITSRADVVPVPTPGTKYILENVSNLPDAIGNSLDSSLFVDNTLKDNDIVVWNNESGNERWELLYNADNPGFGASGGALVFVTGKSKFYGWDGTEWGLIAAGETGETGNTGESKFLGSSYTAVAAGDISAAATIFVDNTQSGGDDPFRAIKIADTDSNGSKLSDIVFPQGTGLDADRVPFVSIFLYNKTNDKMFGFRFKPKASVLNTGTNPDSLVIDSESDDTSAFEVLINDSGSSDWTGSNSWDSGDEITVFAIADGVAGATGAQGVTGQGITFAGTVGDPEELYLQYLDANGNPTGNSFATGIVSGTDGVTGAAGEVGLQMYFTGGSGGIWEENPVLYSTKAQLVAALGSGVPGKAAGGVLFGKQLLDSAYNTLTPVIALSATDLETTTSAGSVIYPSLNLTVAEYNSEERYNRPGTLLFYTAENDYEIRLRSVVGYETIEKVAGENVLLLQGVTFAGNLGDAVNDLSISEGEYGFVLPVPTGIRGQGITLGVVENNALFLDYIDADGVTSGRFRTIEGVTGPQGGMNPFNISYGLTHDGVGSGLTGEVSVISRDSGFTAQSVRLSGVDSIGTTVYDYVNQAKVVGINTGYITIFDKTDVTKYGLFRFTSTASNDAAPGDGVLFAGLALEAGSIAQIVDVNSNSTTGFTSPNEVLFALNLDGKRGFSGEITGYTFGIEYFCEPISQKPQQRSDQSPLEIGDKWFATDVGLEFTFLGSSGDNQGVMGHGVSKGTDTVWVQTNNARQGRRGPQGLRGLDGNTGPRGATGFNHRGVYFSDNSYSQFDIVSTSLAYLETIDPGVGDRPNGWKSFFSGIGLTPAPSNAAFIVTAESGANSGNHPFNAGQPGFNSWSFVVAGGNQGLSGETGPHGSEVISGQVVNDSGDADPAGENVKFTVQNYRDFNKTPLSQTTFTVNDLKGPVGPTGPVGGNNNQYLFKNNKGDVVSNNRLSTVDVAGLPAPALEMYVETIQRNDLVFNTVGSVMTVAAERGSSAIDKLDETADDIETVNFTGLHQNGGAITLLIEGPNTEGVQWTFGNGDPSNVTYTIEGTTVPIENVYISVQSQETISTSIDLPRKGEYGLMTVRRFSDAVDRLFINYVLHRKAGD